MHFQLLGTTQPVLSIALDPGESILAAPGEFAWMTDSIEMSAPAGAEASLPLSAYTAIQVAGTIAFAAKLPGSIVGLDVVRGAEYLVHQHGFLAGTPGITVAAGLLAAAGQEELLLRRIAGQGTAWIGLSGDVVRRELPAGTSLRTHPWHVGMFEASVAVQMAELDGAAVNSSGPGAAHLAVLSGPGAVWLQAVPPRSTLQYLGPATEGDAGPAPTAAHSTT
jgi:uncharacterized protein (AIM24 family)